MRVWALIGVLAALTGFLLYSMGTQHADQRVKAMAAQARTNSAQAAINQRTTQIIERYHEIDRATAKDVDDAIASLPDAVGPETMVDPVDARAFRDAIQRMRHAAAARRADAFGAGDVASALPPGPSA